MARFDAMTKEVKIQRGLLWSKVRCVAKQKKSVSVKSGIQDRSHKQSAEEYALHFQQISCCRADTLWKKWACQVSQFVMPQKEMRLLWKLKTVKKIFSAFTMNIWRNTNGNGRNG